MDEALCKSYRDAVDIKLCRLETKFDSKVEANEKAVQLAREILDRRMEAENRIREELRSQATTFLYKVEFEVQHKNLVEKIDAVSSQASKLDGRMVAIVFIIPIVISILMMLLMHMVK